MAKRRKKAKKKTKKKAKKRKKRRQFYFLTKRPFLNFKKGRFFYSISVIF